MKSRASRGFRPAELTTEGPEPLEPRLALSGIIASLGNIRSPHAPTGVISLAAGGGTVAPVTPGLGQPSARELARERFRGVFNGPYLRTPGRFTDQAAIDNYRGLGGSTQFLHGDYQMSIVYPTDPAGAITGLAYLQDKNVNSSGLIGFDLVGDPTSLDRRGRVTRLTFSADPNIYGGVDFNPTSSGTATIRYGRGSASVVFSGLLYTNNLTNPLRNHSLQESGRTVVTKF